MAGSSLVIARTERLSLHRMALADAPYVLELLNEPSFRNNIGDKCVNTLDDARRYIREVPIAHYNRYGYGAYLVRQLSDAAPIGMCGLYRRSNLDVPDLGFALSQAYTAQGFAREAARAVIGYARDSLGITLLAAVVDPENVRSIHLLASVGFVHRGVYRMPDEDNDLRFYELALA